MRGTRELNRPRFSRPSPLEGPLRNSLVVILCLKSREWFDGGEADGSVELRRGYGSGGLGPQRAAGPVDGAGEVVPVREAGEPASRGWSWTAGIPAAGDVQGAAAAIA